MAAKKPCNCGSKRLQAAVNVQKDLCSMLLMSTPVVLTAQLDVTVGLTGQRISLSSAIAQCSDKQTTGVKLASIVVAGVRRLQAMNKTSAVASIAGRQMPLIMLRDQVLRHVDKCQLCSGAGCATCQHTGVAV